MTQDHIAFPGICRMAYEMAACNNCPTSRVAMDAALDALLGSDGYDCMDLDLLDAWLVALSDEDMRTLVDGEEGDIHNLSARAPLTEKLRGLLQDVWDSVISADEPVMSPDECALDRIIGDMEDASNFDETQVKQQESDVALLHTALADAARWRALIGCGRMHYMGCAGFDLQVIDAEKNPKLTDNLRPVPRDGEYLHFGMEFWSTHSDAGNPLYPDRFEREMVTAFVDHIVKKGGAE